MSGHVFVEGFSSLTELSPCNVNYLKTVAGFSSLTELSPCNVNDLKTSRFLGIDRVISL